MKTDNKIHKRRERERKKASGLIRVEAWIPEGKKEEWKLFTEGLKNKC